MSDIDDFLQIETPLVKLADKSVSANAAYDAVLSDIMDDGNPRQNLATFCQTFMEPQAEKIILKTLDKNWTDKGESPRTAEIEKRCVNIIANLWNLGKEGLLETGNALGVSTVGSTEACMLAGMAMKFIWRKNADEAGVDWLAKKPNLIISSGYQLAWEKFCSYWDVELRTVPMTNEKMMLDPNVLENYIDDWTIGVVGILGFTYTGSFDDMFAINEVLEKYNSNAKIPVKIHVDAASGGLYTPFMNPDLVWDFRLKNVISINASGHKYGLVYPGVGWIVWRGSDYMPSEMLNKVAYLVESAPSISLNFSRSMAHVVAQYYNFTRLGFEGYKKIHQATKNSSIYAANEIEKTDYFKVISNLDELPIICYELKRQVNWNLYDLSERMRMHGWQIPVYCLPPNIEERTVHRIVCRQDFTKNVAKELIKDLNTELTKLNQRFN